MRRLPLNIIASTRRVPFPAPDPAPALQVQQQLPPTSSVTRTKIYYRRQLVAMLWLTGQYTYETLAAKLREEGVTCKPRNVQDDIAFLNRNWQAQANQDVDTTIKIETAKLDSLEVILVSDYKASKLDSSSYIDRSLKIAERRAKLLGLDQPTKIKIDASRRPITSMSDAELEALSTGELGRLTGGVSLIDSSELKQLTDGKKNGG